MNDNITYITKEGLQKIKEELEYLKTDKRVEVAERLAVAIEHGDLSENADYDYAKQEQALLEGRIKDLEYSLRRVEIIEHDGRSDKVRIGSTVTVVEKGYEDEAETYDIVGAHEADPSNGRISNESPIGRALLGAKMGQFVKANTPAGIIEFKVTKIE